MPDLKATLYYLTSELNRLKLAKKNLQERHVPVLTQEEEEELSRLNRAIENKEEEIKTVLNGVG